MNTLVSSRYLFPRRGRFLLLVPIAIFSFAIWRGIQPDANGRWEIGIRIFIPFCAVFFYLLLALALNRRQVLVTPRGVQIRYRPLPGLVGYTIRRPDISSCFIHQVIQYEGNAAVESFWCVSLDNLAGQQVAVSSPIQTRDRALEQAQRVVAILNQDSQYPPLEVRSTPRISAPDRDLMKIMFLWFLFSMLGILLGGIWEISAI